MIYASNSSNAVWLQGNLKASLAADRGVDWTYLDSGSMALTACYIPTGDLGNPAIKAFVGVKDPSGSPRLQEIGVVNASSTQAQVWNSWNFFPNSSDSGGVACAVHDSTVVNLYFVDSVTNVIRQMYYNYNKGTSFTQYWQSGKLAVFGVRIGSK
jgi:hypothetical protein